MPPAGAILSAPPGFTIFFDIISQTTRFSEKKVTEHKMCIYLKNFHPKKKSARYWHKFENIFI
jgi:hypothetical protein